MRGVYAVEALQLTMTHGATSLDIEDPPPFLQVGSGLTEPDT